jgi:hypothetical protein
LGSKPEGVSLRFYRNMSAHDENWLESRISSLWGPYSCSVRHYSAPQFFLRFWKYRVLAQNQKVLAFCFTKNHLYAMKTGQKYTFQPREAHILSWLDILMLYINFWGIWIILSFGAKPKGFSLWFYRKSLFAMKVGWISVFQSRETHILPRLDVSMLYINF